MNGLMCRFIMRLKRTTLKGLNMRLRPERSEIIAPGETWGARRRNNFGNPRLPPGATHIKPLRGCAV
jgi:hypothetical protein